MKALSSISELYGAGAPPSVIMSLKAGFFSGVGSQQLRTYYQLRKCSPCPYGMTSIPPATSVDQCKCDTFQYFDFATGSCKDVRGSCGVDEYIVREYTPTSDTQCLPCPVCPIGFYRAPGDCLSNKLRSFTAPPVCIACDDCPPKYYKASILLFIGCVGYDDFCNI